MVDTWFEAADARHIHVSSAAPIHDTKPGQILVAALSVLTALSVGLTFIDRDTANFGLLLGASIFFGLPLLVVQSWRTRYEIRPREVIQRSGPLGLFTQQSVPRSAFRSVVCDYDRQMVDVTEVNDEGNRVGPTTYEAVNRYRVTLEGRHHAFRLASFGDSKVARKLAVAIASRFELELVDLQAMPSDEEIREAERLMSDEVLVTSSRASADESTRPLHLDRS